MHDINDIDDIRTLVHRFYEKVLNDELLAPVFNAVVEKDQWPGHLEIMVSFWQTNILFEQSYKGNPMAAHIKVDTIVNHTITPAHFERWLQLWNQTIDENFSGETASITKKRARDMAKLIFYKIEQGRKVT
jgi:hemoglobin